MPIDDRHDISKIGELFRNRLLRLLRRDVIRLRQLIAVENRNHIRQRMIDDKIGCLPDLPFARFAVADDAIDIPIDAVHARR